MDITSLAHRSVLIGTPAVGTDDGTATPFRAHAAGGRVSPRLALGRLRESALLPRLADR